MFRAIWQDIREKSRTAKFWLEILAVGGGLFYAGVTYRMWQDSHRNFIIDEQAWVSVAATLPSQVSQGTELSAAIPTTNTGKTAARRLVLECVISRQKNIDPAPLDYLGFHSISDMGLLNPNQTVSHQCWTGINKDERETLNQNQVNDLVNGRAYLAIYGQGQYLDIFGNPHWFRFCSWKAYYNGIGNFNAKSCTDYNDACDGPLPVKE